MSFIAQNLHLVRQDIEETARSAGRDPAAVTLIAVSKTQPAAAIADAIAAGQYGFGENRVQEAALKFPGLRLSCPQLRLHLIGPLQSNKVDDAVRLADRIETLDRPKLLDALARAADRHGRLPELMVQINLGDEPQKSGIGWAEADHFYDDARRRFGDLVCGVMGIGPLDADPAPYFARLAAFARDQGAREMSMGMSGDFRAAIKAGSTHVRIGSAIFGRRPG